MDQLPLFSDIAPTSDSTADATPVVSEPAVIAAPDHMQPGLFDARVAQVRAIRVAIASGELGVALGLLASMESGPDLDVAQTCRRISTVIAELAQADGSANPKGRAIALAASARKLMADREPLSRLGRTLLRRAAYAVEGEDDDFAGRLYLEAGDADRAREVLVSALSRTRSAGLLFVLGDVETVRGDRASARRFYRDALLLDPFDLAFEHTLDPEVRELADVAQADFEVENEPRAWAAAAGMITGVLVAPGALDGDLPEPPGIGPTAVEALRNMRQFVGALAQTVQSRAAPDGNAVVEARRSMKRASPALFAAYMARRVSA